MHEFELIKKYFLNLSKLNKSSLDLSDDVSGSGNKKTFSKKNLTKISKSLSQEQKKYSIFLSGGDTTFSNKLCFSITTVGYSRNIIFRNKAKSNDNIYVTGNLGDSFTGLQFLKNKITSKKK